MAPTIYARSPHLAGRASPGSLWSRTATCPAACKATPTLWSLCCAATGKPLHVFGLSQSGVPKHPLARGRNLVPENVVPQLWTP